MLESLELRNYRSYEAAKFIFSAGVNAVIGPNGSGKTNLLEAIFVLARQRSFRSSLKQAIKSEHASFRVDGLFTDVRLSFLFQTSLPAKHWKVNGHKQKPRRDQLPRVVLFEPEFLRFITGSPNRRRAYLDELTILKHSRASVTLRRYDRVLLQRNNLLKASHLGQLSASGRDQLFVWNIMLSELAARIDLWRLDLISVINSQLSHQYSLIAGREVNLSLSYDLDYEPTQQKIISLLQNKEQSDLRYGYTSVGPHRNDITTKLDGKHAVDGASRGEQRSITICLKLVELAQTKLTPGPKPILLLDDVLSELDLDRQAKLLTSALDTQTILTDTDVKHVKKAKDLNIIGL